MSIPAPILECPFCGQSVVSDSGQSVFSNHIPKCPDRERVLEELEQRAREIRREGRTVYGEAGADLDPAGGRTQRPPGSGQERPGEAGGGRSW